MAKCLEQKVAKSNAYENSTKRVVVFLSGTFVRIIDLSWQIQKPLDPNTSDEPLWLKKIRTLRGEVLYENGLRPFFRLADGSFYDPDPVDVLSWHITVQKNEEMIGTIRLTPLNNSFNCASQKILGFRAFSKLLEENDFLGQNLCEIGRWTVKKSFQRTRLGLFLAVSTIILLKKLKAQAFACCGRKSYHLLRLFGGQLFRYNPGPYFIEKYNDDIFFIDLDPQKIKDKVKQLVPIMDDIIGTTLKL